MKRAIFFLLTVTLLISCGNTKTNIATQTSESANDTIELIDKYLSKLSNDKNFSGGLLIMKGDEKLFSKGYGWADKENKIPFTTRTLASMGSITKAFTATAILKLVEQNKLSLNDELKKFFPSVPADKEHITIHQLLTHSSGFTEFLKDDAGDYEKIETDAYLKRAFTQALAFKPGEKSVYTNVGMSILAIIIEQVSGMDYESYLKKNLFDPIHIQKAGYRYPATKEDTIAVGYKNGEKWGTHQEHFEKNGGGPYWNLKGNGGLEISLDDMYTWAKAISNNSLLSKESTEKMFTPHILEEGNGGDSYFGYGCNISKSRRNTKLIDNGGSNGIYHARLIRLPEEGLIFYMVTNESSINTNMVLPNITQLYFKGKIEQDALTLNMKPQFENELSEKIYDILEMNAEADLEEEFKKTGLKVEDDMILLAVGQKLIEERKPVRAISLYKYYTKAFPKIVVAWNDMGDVYLSQNNKEEAIKCYKQALKIRPENERAKASLDKLK